MAHAHTETAAGRNATRLAIVLGLTSAYMLVELVAGLVTGSLALLADAGHMLADVAGLALALVSIKLAALPATPRRTYGYHRIEILAAVSNAILLFGVSFYILYEAYQRFRSPPEVSSLPMLAVATVGLGVNLVGMYLLRDAAHESLNMKGAYLELLADSITSVGVIVSAVIMLTTQWYYADPLLSAAIGVFILPRTWGLLRDAVNVLLEGTPSDVNLASVRAAIEAVPGVAGVHDLHAWSLTSGVNALSAHVVVAGDTGRGDVRRAIQALLLTSFKLHHITIQTEHPGDEACEAHL